jgi:stage II sporulation protein P
MKILKTKIKFKKHHLKTLTCALTLVLTLVYCKDPILARLKNVRENVLMSSAMLNLPLGTVHTVKEYYTATSSDTPLLTPPTPSQPLPPTSSDTPISAPVISDVPEDRRGKIEEMTYLPSMTKNTVLHGNGHIKNDTNNPESAIKKILTKLHDITIDNSGPQVLIMHTHTTESYEPYDRTYYDTDYTARTTDTQYNMARVGAVIKEELEKNGIQAVQDITLHDHPSYNGSYDRSRVTVKEYLKKYPSIKVVLDVHRDAIEREDGTRVKAVTTVNGKKAAQIMIISGCDDGSMDMPDWRENLRFCAALQNTLETDYPTLVRPVLFCYRKYNQDLTHGSLLVEFGTHANSLSEAVYSAQLFAKSLSKVLKE